MLITPQNSFCDVEHFLVLQGEVPRLFLTQSVLLQGGEDIAHVQFCSEGVPDQLILELGFRDTSVPHNCSFEGVILTQRASKNVELDVIDQFLKLLIVTWTNRTISLINWSDVDLDKDWRFSRRIVQIFFVAVICHEFSLFVCTTRGTRNKGDGKHSFAR